MPPKVKAIALLSGSTNSYIPCVYLDFIKIEFFALYCGITANSSFLYVYTFVQNSTPYVRELHICILSD